MNTKKLTSQAIALLKQLISIESFSGNENKTADAIEKFLAKNQASTFRIGNNILAKNKEFNPALPIILLNSHHDTVKPNAGWTKNPFIPVTQNRKLFGLGSNDAGGALVSLIATFLYFHERKNLKYNLMLAATAEEENSGAGGVKSVYSQIGKIDFVIVGEPTEMKMAVAEKGLMVLYCKAKGKSGHAARDVGENAITNAMRDIEWFHTYQFPESSEILGPVKMTCTIINAGTQHNVIPGECNFTVDIRTNDHYTNEEILSVISRHVKCEITPRSKHLNATVVAQDHILVRAAKKTGIETFGSATSSDLPLWKVPGVKIGPGKSERSHTADEFIFLKEIEEGIKTYINLMEKIVL